MCLQCEPFAERLNFRAPADYVAFVRRLIAQVSAGHMVVIYGDCALGDLADAPPWPTGDSSCMSFNARSAASFFIFPLTCGTAEMNGVLRVQRNGPT